MSDKGWTSGPWKISGNGIDEINHKQVCRKPIGADKTVVGRQWGCNSHLIAAAPDMADALDGLLVVIENNRPDWSHEEIHEARAALAKARGESD